MHHRTSPSLILVLALVLVSDVGAQDQKMTSLLNARDGRWTMNGLVLPLDRAGQNFYLRNADGLVEIQLDEEAEIGLLVREINVLGMLQRRQIVLIDTNEQYVLPDELYVKVQFSNWGQARRTLKSQELRWGIVHVKPLPNHLPTRQELWFSGRISAIRPGPVAPVKEVEIAQRTYLVFTHSVEYSERIVGLFEPSDIRPFVNYASVYGVMKGDVFHASDVLLRPIPDPVATDDPLLPRYSPHAARELPLPTPTWPRSSRVPG